MLTPTAVGSLITLLDKNAQVNSQMPAEVSSAFNKLLETLPETTRPSDVVSQERYTLLLAMLRKIVPLAPELQEEFLNEIREINSLVAELIEWILTDNFHALEELCQVYYYAALKSVSKPNGVNINDLTILWHAYQNQLSQKQPEKVGLSVPHVRSQIESIPASKKIPDELKKKANVSIRILIDHDLKFDGKWNGATLQGLLAGVAGYLNSYFFDDILERKIVSSENRLSKGNYHVSYSFEDAVVILCSKQHPNLVKKKRSRRQLRSYVQSEISRIQRNTGTS